MKFPDNNILDEALNKFKKENPIYSRWVDFKIRIQLKYSNLSNMRYQDCSRLHKLFRMRWYSLVPFILLYRFFFNQPNIKLTFNKKIARFFFVSSLIISEIEIDKMVLYYTNEEITRIFKNKKNQKK